MSWKNLDLQLHPKMLSTNQIAVFCNHQYLWKDSTDLLDFLHGDSHQGKVAPETTTFWLGVACCLSSYQIEGFFGQQ